MAEEYNIFFNLLTDHITGELFHPQKLQLMKQRLQVIKGPWPHIEGLEWFRLGHKASKGRSTNPSGDGSKACRRKKKKSGRVRNYDILSQNTVG